MKRIIKDAKNITEEQMLLITEKYPEGFDEDDLLSIPDAKGKFRRYLEVKTDEEDYLFKVDEEMIIMLDEFSEDEFEMGDLDDYPGEED